MGSINLFFDTQLGRESFVLHKMLGMSEEYFVSTFYKQRNRLYT